MEEPNIPPDRIFNMDEIGLRIAQSKYPAALKHKSQIGFTISVER